MSISVMVSASVMEQFNQYLHYLLYFKDLFIRPIKLFRAHISYFAVAFTVEFWSDKLLLPQ